MKKQMNLVEVAIGFPGPPEKMVEEFCVTCGKRYRKDASMKHVKECCRCHNTRLLEMKNLIFPT